MKTFLNQASKIAAITLTLASLGYASSAVSDVDGLNEWDDPSPWTTVASTCAVDESALKKYAFNNADFYFLGGNVSSVGKFGLNPIIGRCNVDNPLDANVNPKWNTLIIGYSDPDLQKTDASVVAKLIQVKRATGATVILATFDSNNGTVAGRTEGYVPFDTTLDFHNNAYFVQLDLTRASIGRGVPAVSTPIVYSARLVNSSPDNVPK